MEKLLNPLRQVSNRTGLVAWGALLLAAAVACGAPAPTPTPAPPPSIALVSPASGAVIRGDAIAVEVTVSGITMDADGIGKARVPGRGHWHLYVDGNFVGSSAESLMEVRQIPPGEHHILVSLHHNDHSPLNPPVETSAVVEVAVP